MSFILIVGCGGVLLGRVWSISPTHLRPWLSDPQLAGKQPTHRTYSTDSRTGDRRTTYQVNLPRTGDVSTGVPSVTVTYQARIVVTSPTSKIGFLVTFVC